MSVYTRDFWSFGSPGTDTGGYVSQDSSGYLYMSLTNNISGFTVSGSFQKNSIGNDSYLIKFDSNGIPLGGQYIPGIGSNTNTYSYVDKLNNSYITGTLSLSGFTISGLGISKTNTAVSAYFTVFNNSGASQWAKIIDGVVTSNIYPVTSDSSANVYFTTQINTSGFTVSGFGPFNKINTVIQSLIVKYDSTGNPLWSTFLGSSSNNTSGVCIIRSIFTDVSDNMYAVGEFGSISGTLTISGFNPISKINNSTDALILKYDSSGNPLWATMFSGTGADRIQSGTTDSSGNIYVFGETNSSGFTVSGLPSFNKVTTNQDAFLVKLDSSGIPLFGTLITGSVSEAATTIRLDEKNNIYVYGTTGTSGFTVSGLPNFGKTDSGTDGYVVKYNSSGIPKWGTLLSSSGGITAANMIVSGNKVITGAAAQSNKLFYRNIDIVSDQSNTLTLLVTNSNGLPLMSKRFSTGSAGIAGLDVAVDSSGFIYTSALIGQSGFTISGFTPKPNSIATTILVRLDSSGIPVAKLDIEYFNISQMTFQNQNNNLLLVGQTQQSGFTVSGLPVFNKTNTQTNAVFLKYDNSFNPLWGVLMGVSGITNATGCTADSSGNVYIVGDTNQSGFSVSGFPSFNKTSTTTTGFLLKYSPSGTPLWGELISNQNSSVHTITCDSSGFLYVAGTTFISGFTISGLSLPPNQSTRGNIFLVKYDSSGIPVWNTLTATTGGSDFQANSIAVGNNTVSIGARITSSGITISGWINKINGTAGHAEIRFSKSDGSLIYGNYITDIAGSGAVNYPGGLILTEQDEAIVGNYSESSTFTLSGVPNSRLLAGSFGKGWLVKNNSSGLSVWGRQYPGNITYYSTPGRLARFNNGNYVAYGFSSGSGNNFYGYSDTEAYVVTYTAQSTAPEAPSAVTVLSHSNGVASIGWTDGEDGLSPITSYTITGNPGGSAVVTNNPGTISGLVDGVTYTFRVQATNAIGTGTASAPSATSISPSASLSAVQNVSTNPTGITDYMATQTAKPADILALEMRATIQNAGLSSADSILATVQYINGMRTKIGGGVVSTAALDVTDYGTFVATLNSSSMTAKPIDVLYPDYGSGKVGTISLQYAATDNSKYYAVEVPNGYSMNVVNNGKIVSIQFNGTYAVSDGITYGIGDTIQIGNKSLLLTGFGSFAYLVQNMGAGSSDPYITTIDGLHYKLPTMNGPIRFYQGPVDDDVLTVNTTLRVINSAELQKYSLESFLHYKDTLPNNAAGAIQKQLFKNTQLTFFENVYIKYKDQSITLNIWDSEIRVINHKGQIPCKVTAAKIENESAIYKNYKGKTLQLRFGSATVNISVYESPLIRNGISINASNMKAGNGILVNALNSEAIKIPSLVSTQPTLTKGAAGAAQTKSTLQKEFFVDNGGLREKHIVVLK